MESELVWSYQYLRQKWSGANDMSAWLNDQLVGIQSGERVCWVEVLSMSALESEVLVLVKVGRAPVENQT